MQHTDKARAEFEAWAGSEAFGLSPAHFEKDESGEYVNYPTHCYWMVWQASRAAVVIELPPKQRPAVDDDERWHSVRNSTIDACRRYVEAVGVKVKG